ncbi:esiB, partial [Symbiodinium sp. CCMP2456]
MSVQHCTPPKQKHIMFSETTVYHLPSRDGCSGLWNMTPIYHAALSQTNRKLQIEWWQVRTDSVWNFDPLIALTARPSMTGTLNVPDQAQAQARVVGFASRTQLFAYICFSLRILTRPWAYAEPTKPVSFSKKDAASKDTLLQMAQESDQRASVELCVLPEGIQRRLHVVNNFVMAVGTDASTKLDLCVSIATQVGCRISTSTICDDKPPSPTACEDLARLVQEARSPQRLGNKGLTKAAYDYHYRSTLRGWCVNVARNARGRDRKKGRQSDINTDHLLDLVFEQGGLCAYSGVPMEILKPHSHWRASIERIDNRRGYVKGNYCLIAAEFNSAVHKICNEEGSSCGSSQWSKQKVQEVIRVREEQYHPGDFEDQMQDAGGCAGGAALGSSSRNSLGILQAEMGYKAIAGPSDWVWSIERLDNSSTYTKDNCVLIAQEFQTSDHSRNKVGKLRDSELWSEVQKGFKLFGLPESAATTAARWRPDLQGRSNYFAEVESLVAPELSALCVAHPWAFAVGEAAGLSNPWPGRGHNAALRSALALSLHLRATAQAIRAGYPVDNAFFREFGERMSRIHSQEEGTHRRQCQAAQTASKSWSLGTCIDDAKQDEEGGSRASLEGSFLQTVKKSWNRLSEVQPIAVDSQPLDAEALCDRIRAMQLEESTLKLFRASGAWFFEPPTATERPGQRKGEAAKAPEEEDEEKLMELEAKSRSDYNLGVRLLKGKGVKQDEVEAARCFREAADLGHLKASYALGVMLLNGQGVGKDEVLAGAYLKQAAQAGDPKAMYNLSLMYQNAIGVKRDLDVAKEWMEQAAKRGCGSLPWSLGDVGSNLEQLQTSQRLQAPQVDPATLQVQSSILGALCLNCESSMLVRFRLGSMYYEGEKFAPDKACRLVGQPKIFHWR